MTSTATLEQWVSFGGEWVQVGELYCAHGDRCAGLWLAGYRRNGGDVRDERP